MDNFERFERDARRTVEIALTIGVAWLVFVMGVIGVILWMIGKWLAFW